MGQGSVGAGGGGGGGGWNPLMNYDQLFLLKIFHLQRVDPFQNFFGFSELGF